MAKLRIIFRGPQDHLDRLFRDLGIRGSWNHTDSNYCQFATRDHAFLNWYPRTGTIAFQGNRDACMHAWNLLSEALGVYKVEEQRPQFPRLTLVTPTSQKPCVFVVHGHDDVSRDELESILLKLGVQPYILAKTAGSGLTIIEALEKKICLSSLLRFGIVLMTPDDMGYGKRDGPSSMKPRARQNVILELGMLLSALGRDRVAVLRKEGTEIPSDVSGVIYIPFMTRVRECVPKLVERMTERGFRFDVRDVAHAQQ
jgi:predicted nucleotide-binding protein